MENNQELFPWDCASRTECVFGLNVCSRKASVMFELRGKKCKCLILVTRCKVDESLFLFGYSPVNRNSETSFPVSVWMSLIARISSSFCHLPSFHSHMIVGSCSHNSAASCSLTQTHRRVVVLDGGSMSEPPLSPPCSVHDPVQRRKGNVRDFRLRQAAVLGEKLLYRPVLRHAEPWNNLDQRSLSLSGTSGPCILPCFCPLLQKDIVKPSVMQGIMTCSVCSPNPYSTPKTCGAIPTSRIVTQESSSLSGCQGWNLEVAAPMGKTSIYTFLGSYLPC